MLNPCIYAVFTQFSVKIPSIFRHYLQAFPWKTLAGLEVLSKSQSSYLYIFTDFSCPVFPLFFTYSIKRAPAQLPGLLFFPFFPPFPLPEKGPAQLGHGVLAYLAAVFPAKGV